MSTMLEAIGRVKVGIWQFVRLVFNSNRDYPFHDYAKFDLYDYWVAAQT